MNELFEIRRRLDELHDLGARTSQDVRWIREGMERGEQRMDTHESRISKMESKDFRQSGFVAGLSAMIGMVTGLIGAKFGLRP